MTRIDVLGIGCAAIDDTIYISGIPPTNGKTRVVAMSRDFGGLTATALAAASRLGAKCYFAGMLGSDRDSIAVVRDLRRAGVVVSRREICDDARPFRSTIITSIDQGSRAIYFCRPSVVGAHPGIPERTIRSSRVLLVDGYGIDGSLRASEIARSAGIPIVADFDDMGEEGFPRLLELVDHLILSAGFARSLTGASSTTAALGALWSDRRTLLAITDGEDGCWVMTRNCREAVHVPAYQVVAVDTTGCGDVFHGAYAAALAFRYETLRAVQFASVAAGLKAAHRGTREALPSRTDVESRLSVGDRNTAVRSR